MPLGSRDADPARGTPRPARQAGITGSVVNFRSVVRDSFLIWLRYAHEIYDVVPRIVRNLNCYTWNLPVLRDDDRSPTMLISLPSVLDSA
jgi:hypothetical protein